MHDSESTTSTLTAGTLELTAEPSWGNDSETASFGSASKDDSGRETISLSVSTNPAYVWFRTSCPRCVTGEEELFVRFGVNTDPDAGGAVDRWLTNDYLSLRDARDQFDEGIDLGELGTTDTWLFVVDWEIREHVKEDIDVEFDFDFYAAQSRHVMNADSIVPNWETHTDCCGPTTRKRSGISWVAFCSPEPISKGDFDFTRSDDHRTLTMTTLPDSVDTVMLKYGTSLDVFRYDGQDSFTVGSDRAISTHTQESCWFPGTEPQRSNPLPCPDSYGCKYEFSDGGGGGEWECKGPDASHPKKCGPWKGGGSWKDGESSKGGGSWKDGESSKGGGSWKGGESSKGGGSWKGGGPPHSSRSGTSIRSLLTGGDD